MGFKRQLVQESWVCLPPGHPGGDPDETLGSVDDILSDGEDHNLFKGCPWESPDMSSQQVPAKTTLSGTGKTKTSSRPDNGMTLNWTEKSTTLSGTKSHSTLSGSEKGQTFCGEDQSPTLSRELECTKQTGRRVPKGKASCCELTKSRVNAHKDSMAK